MLDASEPFGLPRPAYRQLLPRFEIRNHGLRLRCGLVVAHLRVGSLFLKGAAANNNRRRLPLHQPKCIRRQIEILSKETFTSRSCYRRREHCLVVHNEPAAKDCLLANRVRRLDRVLKLVVHARREPRRRQSEPVGESANADHQQNQNRDNGQGRRIR